MKLKEVDDGVDGRSLGFFKAFPNPIQLHCTRVYFRVKSGERRLYEVCELTPIGCSFAVQVGTEKDAGECCDD